MTTAKELDFKHCQKILSNLPSAYSLEYCHGLLVGMLCANHKTSVKEWLIKCLSKKHVKSLNDEMTLHLAKIYQNTTTQIKTNTQPLISTDTENLNTQINSLKKWCLGLLDGVGGLNHIKDINEKKIVDEIIKDLKIISIDEDNIIEDEQNNRDYFEIFSYVTVASTLLYETSKATTINSKSE